MRIKVSLAGTSMSVVPVRAPPGLSVLLRPVYLTGVVLKSIVTTKNGSHLREVERIAMRISNKGLSS